MAVSKATLLREEKAVQKFREDMEAVIHAFGEQAPLHGAFTNRENDLCSLTVHREGKSVFIRYVWMKRGSGQREFVLEDNVQEFIFERFCHMIFGRFVKDTARRHYRDGIKVDDDFDQVAANG